VSALLGQKFGQGWLHGQQLTEWIHSHPDQANSFFSQKHVPGYFPYEVAAVILLLNPTHQHPAQPDARPQPQSGEDVRLAARVLSPASVFSQAGEVAPPDSLTHETFQLFSQTLI
jgi:hypothetical protein